MSLDRENRTELLRLYMDKAAESLADAREKSVSLSTRVNRAYYCVFYCATALLLSRGIEGYHSHKGLLSAFGKVFVKDGVLPRQLGVDLRLLEKARYTADYSPKAEITAEEADEYVRAAENFYNIARQELLRS